jgi:hypothetical protein
MLECLDIAHLVNVVLVARIKDEAKAWCLAGPCFKVTLSRESRL